MADRTFDTTTIGAITAVAAGLISAAAAVIMAVTADTAPPPADTPSTSAAPVDAPPEDSNEAPAPAVPAAPENGPEDISSAVAPASVDPRDNTTVFAEIIAYQDSALTFEATFPPGARSSAVLSGLRNDAALFLENMKSNAQMAYSADMADGMDPNPWDVDITWRETAKAGDVASFTGVYYAYTGGAHGNVEYETLIANAATGERIDFMEMFLPRRSPSPAFVIGLCQELKAQKTERTGEALVYGDPIVCNGAGANIGAETPIVALSKSTEPGKFGGAEVYYPPYAIGPYAEGPYVISVPQGIFVDDLRPQFAELFAGDPILSDR